MKSIMQRILCVLLAVLTLTLAACPAFASAVDLSGMTDDELLELQEALSTEIVSRGIRMTAELPKGKYIVGRDIPAGAYIFTCLAVGNDWGYVRVKTDGGDGDQLLFEVVSAPEDGEEPETIYMNLSEGDELKSSVKFSLTVAGGFLFR